MRLIKKLFGGKKDLFLLLMIVFLSSYLRFSNISGLKHFTYDQARDALYVKRMIVDHKFRLIGTQSSIPGLYTPPFYYYLMVIPLWLSGFNPVGLDCTTAIFGVVTVVVLFGILLKLTKNQYISFLISILYSTQPAILYQSRFAWNPNTMPFFVLLAIYGMLKIVENKDKLVNYFIFFLSLGMTINLHYSGIIFTFVAILALFIMKKFVWKKLLISSGALIFLVAPILIFDLKHNFVNIKGIINYLTVGTINNVPPSPFFSGVIEKYKSLVGLLVPTNINIIFFDIFIIMFTIIFIYFVFRKRDKLLFSLSFIFILSVIFSSLYQRSFFFFYLTFLFPIPFLLVGRLSGLTETKTVKQAIFFIIIILILNNFVISFKQINEKTKDFDKQLNDVAMLLSSKVKSPFNLVSIYLEPERFGYNAVDYRYFLETFYQKTSLDWDPLDYQNAQNLYVISEVGEVDPLKLNIWEVKTFSPRLLSEKWQIDGINIYHLVK